MVAASAEQRERGLMEVTDLAGYEGMLFVWDDDTRGGFWMRNTPTPLSIAWVDAEGGIVSSADMEPCADSDDCPTYPPDGRYRFALEVPKGELGDDGRRAGQHARAWAAVRGERALSRSPNCHTPWHHCGM